MAGWTDPDQTVRRRDLQAVADHVQLAAGDVQEFLLQPQVVRDRQVTTEPQRQVFLGRNR
jgi:hypothetical protein